ncbi:MAG TPA: RHS repeat-associated core domain-containing protein, partial [Bryobacteraceae bacterium]|nr:RHS repeat-associated core domain-containing protein [Bryobacteraceae bacterium]
MNNGNVVEQKIWAKKATAEYLELRQDYGYDEWNRLTTFVESVVSGGTGGSWGHTNSYDRWGNRWAAGVLPRESLTPGAQSAIDATKNQVVKVGANPAAITYTASGEMKSHPDIGVMKWDVEGRMREAGGAAYGYDAEGKRVKKTAGGVTTYYVSDGMGNLGAEYGGAATGTMTKYLMADHLGSTRVVMDGTGGVTARCDYAPFGETIDASVAYGNRNVIPEYGCGEPGVGQKFTGKERDAETGLDYFGARYMASAMGRFTSPNPKMFPDAVYDPQSWNKYGYVRNNPLRLVDPNGEDWKDVASGFFNAFNTNQMMGIGRTEGGNSDFRTGQAFGDAVSTIQGVAEMIVGTGGEVGGIALDSTVVGATLGIPLNVASAGVIVHGTAVAGT